MIKKLFWKQLMRIDLKSKNKFNVMIKRVFNDNSIPFIKGCSINSKNIKNGDIFFALKGQEFDGHTFIGEALDNGASLIINDRNIDIRYFIEMSIFPTTQKANCR